jgi:diguanylate cyclase (GGDEF)-like protein
VLLDYTSLLIALGFSSAGLALTFFVSWFVAQTERVVMTWAVSATLLVVSIFVYQNYVSKYSPLVGAIAFAALLVGLAFLMGAARQFRTGHLPLRTIALVGPASVVVMAVPMFVGYDGLSCIVFNLAATAILLATAYDYWHWRAEARIVILILVALYTLTGLSFALCAIVLISDGQLILHHAPASWAEDVNLGVSLTSIAGIGALSLALHQFRLARGHKRDAETDALTGLFNRRALFGHPLMGLAPPVVVVIFDIDHFKPVNDIHGHQTGDNVLRSFGAILAASIRDNDLAARHGGEEFALILHGASASAATVVAERVRKTFAEWRFTSPAGDFACTVSAGISHAAWDQADLVPLLREADAALYEAKRAGRNSSIVYSEKIQPSPSTMWRAEAHEDVPPARQRCA